MGIMSDLAHLRIRGSLVSVKGILLLHQFKVIGVGDVSLCVLSLSKIFTKWVSYTSRRSNKPTREVFVGDMELVAFGSWPSYLALLLT